MNGYRASEFAGRAGVTVRALHHYDRLGLLQPRRSPAGYRLYADADLARLQQIVALKFAGFPLRQIRDLLDRRSLDLPTVLRLQRELLERKRERMLAVVRALAEAERIAAAGGEPDWKALNECMEEGKDVEWMKRYYTDEQWADLARRGTPEVCAQGQRDWADLLQEVESARGADPASPYAQSLLARWDALIAAFTGGDPGIASGLRRLYADQKNWPSSFQQPFSDEAADFVRRARASSKRGDPDERTV